MKHLILFSLIVSCVTVHGQTDPAEAGPRIVAEAFGKLSGALSEAITSGGTAKALPVCSERAPQIASEVGKANGVVLRRSSDKPRNRKNAADAVENAALEEFSLALSRKEAPTPKVIPNADGSTSFLSPILIGSSLCLQCHGIPGTDIAPDTGEAIIRHYPDDKATGYRLGELRGLWHVTFPSAASAGEVSVMPGINKNFLDPNLKVEEWTQKFETESREIYHLRKEIVMIDFKRIPGESSDFVMGHVRAGQEVFESEIIAAGFEKADEVKDLLEENYFVKFRRK